MLFLVKTPFLGELLTLQLLIWELLQFLCYPIFSKEEIIAFNHSDAKLVFVSQRLSEKIENQEFENIDTIVNLDNFEITLEKEIIFLGKKTIPTEEDLAVIIYTSGTSGFSKGVMLTHGNLASQLVQVHHIWPIKEEDIYLSVLPLSHTFLSWAF